MKEYIKIAWRNLWRNRRRTAITSASILFAVFFALLMRSFQLGFYDHMVTNAIETYSGFIQIQHQDYPDDPSLENTIESNDSLYHVIENIQGVKAVVPRIETFALASSGNQTKGAAILGIDPVKEKELSNPEHFLVRYRVTTEKLEKLKQSKNIPEYLKDTLPAYLNQSYSNTGTLAMDLSLDEKSDKQLINNIAEIIKFHGEGLAENDDGVLVSDRLAKFLRLNVGDTLILMGVGYQGRTAANLFPVRGIVKIPNPELDNKLVYMDIGRAQQYSSLDIDNRITSIAVNLTDNSDKSVRSIQNIISDKLSGKNVVVRNWKEFNKVLAQQIESDNKSGILFLALLYFIIFFGIFGTVIMMIQERYREFGVLVSVGMQKTKLASVVIIEMLFIGIIGVLLGMLISLPIIYFFYANPVRLSGEMAQMMEDMGFEAVVPLMWINTYMLWQGIIVALMVVMASIYPLRKVFKLNVVKALKA